LLELGVFELAAAVLIALKPWWPKGVHRLGISVSTLADAMRATRSTLAGSSQADAG
jgi:hypothetical protein